ncbi:MAG: ElyC/SanA/YdcF family protein [Bacteroidota bacterium]
MSKFKKRLLYALLLVCLGAFVVVLNYRHVDAKTGAKLYDDLAEIPPQKVGLVLGTSRKLANGQGNLFYRYRLEAAYELYSAGKVEYLLLSGDNGTKYYNEPADMQADLIAMGVPEDHIYLDYAGFRTLDSVVRAKAVFGQDAVICISQPSHLARAVYIGQQKDIKMSGYTAQRVNPAYGRTVLFREYLARVKMQLDLLFGIEPRFYGEPIQIG